MVANQLTLRLPMRLTTYIIPIKPIDRITENQSRLLVWRAMTSRIRPVPAITIIAVITSMNRTNRLFQSKNFSTIPETIGPHASAEPMTRPATPMTVPRFAFGVISSRTDW